MFAIPATLGLVFLVFIRPQMFIPALVGVPLVAITYLASALGLVLDLRLRLIRAIATPLLLPAAAFFVWCLVTVAIRKPAQLGTAAFDLFVPFLLFFIVGHSIQSLRALKTVIVALVAIGLFLSAVGVHQRFADMGCIMFNTSPFGVVDGRPCTTQAECQVDPEPGAHYACEHVGLFGTTSVKERVRWLGIIQDPNEMAMYISICLPLLIGLYQLRPNRWRGLLLAIGALLIGACVVFTQSRGGQIVFMLAIGVYFVRRFGLTGVAVCLVAALPIVLLGGRSGEEAEASRLERLDALYIAMTLMRQYPLAGVGWGNYTDFNYITAHNSYALSASELGLPGLFFFVVIFYQLMKINVVAVRRYPPTGPSRAAHVWAVSFIAAQCGLMAGILLLSFNTHQVLWMYCGIASAFGLAVQRHDPGFRIKMTARDYAAAAIITLSMASVMFLYSRRH